MPSSVDKRVFRAGDRAEARRALGLPVEAKLVGTAGSLFPHKGIADLYAAWPQLRDAHPDLHLVLAGPRGDVRPPREPRVHDLGSLPHERVADLFRALDVGAICVRDTKFGRYCFPQKAYEMLACGLSVVAADVGATGRFFAPHPECLYRVGDGADLAAKVAGQLQHARRPTVRIDGWAELIEGLEPRLKRLAGGSSGA